MLSKRVAHVQASWCVACGACARECPKSAIRVWRGCRAQVEPEVCVGCGKCARVCPTDAVTVGMREESV